MRFLSGSRLIALEVGLLPKPLVFERVHAQCATCSLSLVYGLLWESRWLQRLQVLRARSLLGVALASSCLYRLQVHRAARLLGSLQFLVSASSRLFMLAARQTV